jgi:hypothetical protein
MIHEMRSVPHIKRNLRWILKIYFRCTKEMHVKNSILKELEEKFYAW